MSQVTLTIDGKEVTVEAGTTVLEAARKAAIDIPVLCYHPELRPEGACRICVVEIEGARNLPASCVTPVAPGMVVRTNTPAVREARRTNLELLLANHPQDCFTCERNNNCELQALARDLGIKKVEVKGVRRDLPLDKSGFSLVRDPNKCVLCGRCVRVCSEVQGVSVLDYADRGFEAMVYPPLKRPLDQVACVNCGQCATVCPVGAITERSDVDRVWEALADDKNHVVIQVAPAVRVSIGEELGMPPGSITTGKLVAALRRLGFHKVFDTDFTADLTIMEEGHELLERLENGGVLPMFTSCSPGWIKFIEHYHPDMLAHLSSCKSPQQMFGALAKTYYASKAGYSARDIFVVSIMPCTAKKFEAARPEMNSSGVADVDVVLTTRELGKMIREAGINFAALPEEAFDEPLGISTGAGVIFGASGGVAEAALRTIYEVVTGEELKELDFTAVRGLKGIKEAAVTLKGRTIRIAVTHGLKNADNLLKKIKAGEADYDFVEIMCCPGGCIGGGGQPIPVDREIREKRMSAIYAVDRGMELRKSHLNPAVQELYKTFLEKPLGSKSHELLHTHYQERSRV
ncbi:MAG: 2Fe-2S iron-sulfur cluster binding domain-containing protein [Firmicutes bacterium]|jgi:NADH-quinone oxidoreductase subunit G/NADP-reducing hydrogenase subunit HndD|nr:2Fe-2S iron-sulfur cluster binding domain-containing protein [Bacillota bacterium]